MKRIILTISALGLLWGSVSTAAAQTGAQEPKISVNLPRSSGPAGPFSGFVRRFQAVESPEVSYANSGRLDALLRAGNLYLSLQDAIALALENNLDIESKRYDRTYAEADLLRAKAGSLLNSSRTGITRGPSSASGPGVLSTSNMLTSGASSTLSSTGGSFGGLTIQSIGTSIPNLDPVFSVSNQWLHQTSPLSSRYVSGTLSNYLVTSSTGTSASFHKGFLTGGSLNLEVDTSRVTQPSPNLDLNPYKSGNATLTFSQPLLQGFGLALNSRNIHIAKNNLKVNDLAFKAQVMSTVSSVISLYWDLVSFREDLKVKEQALALSEKLYNDNKKQVEIGTMAPIEIVRAEAEVAARQADLTTSQTAVVQQETILKNYLSRTGVGSAVIADAHIIPTDHIEIPEKEPIQPIQDLVVTALSSRPDIAEGQIQIENNKISMKGVKNALRPSLSVFAYAQNNATAGSINPIQVSDGQGGYIVRNVDPYFVGGYGTVFSQIFRRSFPDYGAGFSLSIPLRNDTARGNYIQGQMGLRQAEIAQRKAENTVRVDVQNALIGLQQARARYESASKARNLQEQNLDAEQKKYTLGATTVFLVIQAQRDLATARSTEVSALSTYAKAKAGLDDVMGRTLEVNNVSIDEAIRGKVARAPQIPIVQQ